MLTCPRCNTRFYQDMKICPQCGLSDPVLFCRVCNNPLDLRYTNCVYCRTPFQLPPDFLQQPANTSIAAPQSNQNRPVTPNSTVSSKTSKKVRLH